MWLLATASLAASPGGFRAGPALPVRSVELREAVALDADWVSQTTLAARTNLGRRASVRGELPLVVSGGDVVSTRVGLLRLGAYAHLGRNRRTVFTLGAEAAAPVTPTSWRAQSWSTVARDTVPAGEVLAMGAVTFNPAAPFTIRTGLGFRTGPFESTNRYASTLFVAELSIHGVLPMSDRTAIAVETELMVDRIPWSLRSLFRVDLEAVTVDVGPQLGISVTGRPTFAALTAVRRWF